MFDTKGCNVLFKNNDFLFFNFFQKGATPLHVLWQQIFISFAPPTNLFTALKRREEQNFILFLHALFFFSW